MRAACRERPETLIERAAGHGRCRWIAEDRVQYLHVHGRAGRGAVRGGIRQYARTPLGGMAGARHTQRYAQ